MVSPSFDEVARESLRPGPFPAAASVEVQDVWMAVSALEDRVRGTVAGSAESRDVGPPLTSDDRELLMQMVARLAVILAVRM